MKKSNSNKLYLFGFSLWKHSFILPFFPNKNLIFCSSLEDALKKELDKFSSIYIWGKKPFDEVENYAKKKNIKLFYVEDGFIRSLHLGSDLTAPFSLTVDSKSLYFDATKTNDLEELLNSFNCTKELLKRASFIKDFILKNNISKYNYFKDKKVEFKNYTQGQKKVLVIGQVEDDASIIYGANGMTNRELLEEVYTLKKDEFIIYKPHPDVIVGNRKGEVKNSLDYASLVVEKLSLDSILKEVDEVHTMTSLVGFEALLRGKKVFTYGMPFYAGWGLTIDKKINKRRVKKRTLEELIAISLIIYPKYINPIDSKLCEIEKVLETLASKKEKYHKSFFKKELISFRHLVSRKSQLLLRKINGK